MENLDWRIHRKSLKDKMEHLFSTTLFSDVTITVGKGNNKKIFLVHSVFLKMASPVFERMLEGEFQEKSHKIDIDNVDPQLYGMFLEFIYTESAYLKSYGEACELYKMGHAYLFEPLQEFCLDYLFCNLCPSTALDAYNIGDLYDIKYLRLMARRIMVRKTFEFVSCEDFVCADESLILSLLDEPSLNISQFQLFKSIEKWIEYQPKKPSLLNVIARKFHYLEMSPEEFINGPSQSNLLTSEQKIGVYQNMLSKNSFTLPEGFKQKRDPCLHIAHHVEMKSEHYRGGYIAFTCDKAVAITAVGISTREFPQVYKEVFNVIICCKEKYISDDEATIIQADVEGGRPKMVKLKRPVRIIPGREYKMIMILDTISSIRVEVANLIDRALLCDGVIFHFTQYLDADAPIPLQSIQFAKL